MKRTIGLLGLVAGVVLAACAVTRADVYTFTKVVTNAQPISYSDPLPVSGWLDKIEIFQSDTATSTVTVATYNGTTAVDTYATKAFTTAAATVFRTRVIGTTSAGVAITAAFTAGTSTTNYSTILTAPFERPMLGSNLKCAVTGTANDGANTITVRIFFEPVAK